MLRYVIAFALTVAVEVPVYVVALHAGGGLPWQRGLRYAVVVNVITHPLLWLSLLRLSSSAGYWAILVGAECLVVVAEWLLLLGLTRGDHVDMGLLAGASLAANAASTLVGILMLG